jgi:NAD(P)H-flavin reductase
MYELLDRLEEYKKLHFRGGCKNPREFLYREETAAWADRKDIDAVLTVDQGGDGWKGKVGLVTSILDGLKMDFSNGIAVVCGPPIMMKFATEKIVKMGFKKKNIYLSMERNMSCGFGKCGHCRLGTYYVCKDGPVFQYDLIKGYEDLWL